MKCKQLIFLAGLCLMYATLVPAWADLVPPGAMEARERFAKHKDLFDRTDQFCRKKAIGAACEIPGTAFEGGGKGVCQRDLPDRASEIDLRCTLTNPPVIDRSVPNGPYRKDSQRCDGTPENPGEDEGFSCIDPPPVSDRFCAGHKPNDSCTAVFTVAAKEQREVGRCGMTIEEYKYYQYGYRRATRRVSKCLPKLPAPVSTFSRVPLTSKLRP